MTDRELLVLAAKAAGIKIGKSEFNGGGRGNTGFNISGDVVVSWHDNETWNPLRDDGDALRLAVKLRMLVDVTRFSTTAIANGDTHAAEKHNGDPYAATRRAIVRAAAAIGEGMK